MCHSVVSTKDSAIDKKTETTGSVELTSWWGRAERE